MTELTTDQKKYLYVILRLKIIQKDILIRIFDIDVASDLQKKEFWKDITYFVENKFVKLNDDDIEINPEMKSFIMAQMDNKTIRIIDANPILILKKAQLELEKGNFKASADLFKEAGKKFYKTKAAADSVFSFYKEAECYSKMERYVHADYLYKKIERNFIACFKESVWVAKFYNLYAANCLMLGLTEKGFGLMQRSIKYLNQIGSEEAIELSKIWQRELDMSLSLHEMNKIIPKRTTRLKPTSRELSPEGIPWSEVKVIERGDDKKVSTFELKVRNELFAKQPGNGIVIILFLILFSVPLSIFKGFSTSTLLEKFLQVTLILDISIIIYSLLVFLCILKSRVVPIPKFKGGLFANETDESWNERRRMHWISKIDAIKHFVLLRKKILYLLIIITTSLFFLYWFKQ